MKSKNKPTSLPRAAAYLRLRPTLFNCMRRFLGMPDEGTHFWSDDVNTMSVFDQFITSRGLLRARGPQASAGVRGDTHGPEYRNAQR